MPTKKTEPVIINYMNKLQLTRGGPGQFMIFDTAKNDYVLCNHWPLGLANEIIAKKKILFRTPFVILNNKIILKP